MVTRKISFLFIILIYLVVGIVGFNSLILQQENILRKYFIINPQERIKESNLSLSNSLSKYFIRENRGSELKEVTDYIRKYGKTSLFEMIFVFKDKDGSMKQVAKSGVSPVSQDVFASDVVYPAEIDNGAMQGYLLVIIKESGTTELREGLRKYNAISYSLRFLFFLFTAALLIIAFYHTYSAKMKLAKDIAEIRASNDGLTELHTHEYFMKLLEIEVEKLRLYNTPLALIMLDIDRFKDFNDQYGHLAGDKMLQEFARIIKSNTRATDILSRYGGDEFSIIAPYVMRVGEVIDRERFRSFVEDIKNMAERIRKSAEECKLEFSSNVLNFTISIGIVFYYGKAGHITGTALLQKADSDLYQAKKLGGNRIYIDYESTHASHPGVK